MELTFEIQTTQKTLLSQFQLHSLEILSMDSTQLWNFMQNEYLENPMMEYSNNHDIPYRADDISKRYEQNITYGKTYEEMIAEDDQRRQDLPSSDPQQLHKLLIEQLPFQNWSKKQTYLFQYMIDSLDESGFFTASLEEIASETHTDIDAVRKALRMLQQLEPHGIFASDLRECLLIQLDFAGKKNTDIWNIVSDYLDEVAKGHISVISRALSLSTSQVRRCIEQIAQLNPRPMNSISFGNAGKQYVIPDIVIKKEHNQWIAELNDQWVEDYHINDYYIKLMNKSQDKELTSYFQKKLERLILIQKNIKQRRMTIQSIMQAIIERQSEFLDNKRPLRPMTMSELAEELSIHSSTVSRAVKGKYVQCAIGTIPLRNFFSSAVSDNLENDTAAISASEIKEIIRGIIYNENRKSPLSDQKILNLLKEQNIHISRRAVTSYRESLGIKSSYERKHS